MDPQSRLKQLKKHWGMLTQSAVWVLGIIGGFLLPPPPGGVESENSIWTRFAQFVLTILIGLMLVLAHRWRQKKYLLRWSGISVVSLLLAVGAFFYYQYLVGKWTVPYVEGRVVMGSEYTEQGAYYTGEHPGISPETLVMDFAGQEEEIWEPASIHRRWLLLAGVYTLCLPLFTICLMSTVQAVNCLQSKKER